MSVRIAVDGEELPSGDGTGGRHHPLGSGDTFVADFTKRLTTWEPGDGKSWIGTHVVLLEVLFQVTGGDGEGVSLSKTLVHFDSSFSQYGQDLWVLRLAESHSNFSMTRPSNEPLVFVEVCTVPPESVLLVSPSVDACKDKYSPHPIKQTHLRLHTQIGAFHAREISNTFVLESRGWHGLCIEPFPVLASFVQRAELAGGGRHVLVQAAVEDAAGVSSFCTRADGDPGGGLRSDLHRSSCEDAGLDEVNATTQTIGSILATNFAGRGAPGVSGAGHAGLTSAFCTIHYLSLDTEGSEARILESFPFEDFFVAAMTVEHNFDRQKSAQLRRILQAHGYILSASLRYSETGRDMFAYHAALDDPAQRALIPPPCRLL